MPRPFRGAARSLALAAALALGVAGGCKPSSLTPFGIGERGPNAPSPDDVNGLWQGVGSVGEQVHFQVGSGTLTDLRIAGIGRCGRLFISSEVYLLEGSAFDINFELTSGGRVFISGTFTSGTTCSGTYSYAGVSIIEGCEREGAGSFVATKTR